MAFRVPRNIITEEKKEIISKCLLYEIQSDSYSNNIVSSSSSEVIKIFKVDGDDVLLPYCFGKKLLGEQTIDLNKPKYPYQFTSTLFDHQKPIFEQALREILSSEAISLCLYTGFGKTIMGAALSSALGLRTCVVTVQTVLPKQWVSTYEEHTDAKVEIFTGKPIKPDTQIIISTIGTLEKMPEEVRRSIGTLIIDEAHCFCTKTRILPLLCLEPKYIIAETATFNRPDGAEAMMKAFVGTKQIIVPLNKKFKVIKVNTKIAPDVIMSGFGANQKVNWNHFVKSLVTNPHRNELITSWILKNLESNKALLLADRKELISNISNKLKDADVKHDIMCGNKKTYMDSNILLGTQSKIGVGFDEKNACMDFSGKRINLAYIVFSTKQQALLEQCAGRAFRSEMPTIVDFVDDHPICQRHFKQREKWYKSRGGVIEEYTVAPPKKEDIST